MASEAEKQRINAATFRESIEEAIEKLALARRMVFDAGLSLEIANCTTGEKPPDLGELAKDAHDARDVVDALYQRTADVWLVARTQRGWTE